MTGDVDWKLVQVQMASSLEVQKQPVIQWKADVHLEVV